MQSAPKHVTAFAAPQVATSEQLSCVGLPPSLRRAQHTCGAVQFNCWQVIAVVPLLLPLLLLAVPLLLPVVPLLLPVVPLELPPPLLLLLPPPGVLLGLFEPHADARAVAIPAPTAAKKIT